MVQAEATEVIPGQRLVGRVLGMFSAPEVGDEYGFVTHATETLDLTFEGIPGDRHFGWIRRSGGREPWYPRATEMRNERQVSLLAPDDMVAIAERLGVPEVKPEWIGGNLLIDGLPSFSMIPSSTRLSFQGGAVIAIEAQNRPCRFAGKAIAEHYPDRPDIQFLFPKVARHIRGLVGWVERPGAIKHGAAVTARIPEQWIYRGLMTG